ncbi:hypothetical protein Hanom_Chr05g00388211 [Helianthus anomalus]
MLFDKTILVLKSMLHEKINRVKCHFSPCGLGHFTNLVQRFYFSFMASKMFHRCRFSPLG